MKRRCKRLEGDVARQASFWERISTKELTLKLRQLMSHIRGPRDERIKRSINQYVGRMISRSPREIALTSRGREMSLEELEWRGSLRAEVSFLRDYIPGVGTVFLGLQSLKHSELPLTSGELVQIWRSGIDSQWRAFFDHSSKMFASARVDGYPDLGEELGREYTREARLVRMDSFRDWQVRIEEAKSAERFKSVKTPQCLPNESSVEGDSAVSPHDLPRGAKWSDVQMNVEEHALGIEVKGHKMRRTFQEAGFEDKRTGKVPDKLWSLLRAFAIRGGTLPFKDPKLRLNRPSLKQSVSQLRKRLNALLPINGNPLEVPPRTRHYRCAFRIFTEDTASFPTPSGTTWDRVSIAEVQPNMLRFCVDATETFGTYVRGSRNTSVAEAGVRESRLQSDFSLRSLGITSAEGVPNPVGVALLMVLHEGGRIERGSRDPDMLKLGRLLSEFMQIEDPAFKFLEPGIWQSNFHVSSRNTMLRR